MSLLVTYADAPVGAQEKMVVTATPGQAFSQAEALKDFAPDVPWATLEPAGWLLNGTRKLLGESPGDLGWWSDVRSNADGSFSEPPVLEMTFSQRYSANGITLSFCPALGQWCSQVQVQWYRGSRLLDETMTYPDEAHWVLHNPVENFDKVVIRLLKTNIPGQFAKLRQLQIGQVFLFMRDELVSVRLLNEIDPSLCRLSVDTMTVNLRDRKGRTLVPEKDKVIRLYRDNVQIAAHYVTDAARQSRQNYRVQCQSAIGRLEDSFLGGFYDGYPLQSLLQAVLGEFPFYVDGAFAEETVTGYLPVCSRRQALQQIAFAVGGVVTTRGDGTIRLLRPEQSVSGSFQENSIFAGADLKQNAAVAAVELYTHRYLSGDGETVILKETELFGEELFLVFSEPYFSYHIDGGTIIDSDVNWIRLTGNGVVHLTGRKYRHVVGVRSKHNPYATAAEKGNVITVENATLIHDGNVAGALERLYRYSMLQLQLNQDVVVTNQSAGQMVESRNPWGERIAGYITAMDSTFTDKSHRANIQICGREVQL